MFNTSGYTRLIRKEKRMFLSLIITSLFASSAIGVQRTILTLYTDQLSSGLEGFILLSGAIALSGYGFAKAVGNLIGGNILQKIGRRVISRLGLIILGIGSFAVLIVNTLQQFLIVNLLIGTGVGLFLASTTIMFTEVVSSKRRAKSISMMELSVYGGTSLGSILAGITSVYGYIYSFAAAFLLVVLAILVSLILKDSSKLVVKRGNKTVEKRARKIVGLKKYWNDLTSKSLLETKDLNEIYQKLDLEGNGLLKESQFNKRQLLHPSFMFTFTKGLISRISDTAIILLLPLYLVSYNYSILELGIITSSFTIMWAFGMFISGPISDEVGRKQPLVLGIVLELTGLSVLLLPALNEQFLIALFAILLAGFGRGTYYVLPPSIIADQVSIADRPKVLGFYRFILDSGYVIGSIILVILIEPVLFGQTTDPRNVFTSTWVVLIFLLLLQAILTGILLRDPKPRFSQFSGLEKHLLQVQISLSLLNQAIVEFASNNIDKSKCLLKRAKIIEKKADLTLEKIIEHTYSGAITAVDALELLEFGQKLDRALSHSIRGVRYLHQINVPLTQQFLVRLSQFAIMLDFMTLETVEVIKLLPIKISIAAQQSYQVNRLEEYLDTLHQMLWEDTTYLNIDGLQSVLLVNSIESLEKTANTIEDAVQLIRQIAIKHYV